MAYAMDAVAGGTADVLTRATVFQYRYDPVH
jgi:hypothetical protein